MTHGNAMLLCRYSMLLYMVNICLVMLFAFLTFKLKHIGGRTLRSETVSEPIFVYTTKKLDYSGRIEIARSIKDTNSPAV